MKEIKIPGFTTNIQADDALAIGIFGEHGAGKTRFCITAPDPIGFIPLDRKARKTIEKTARELGKVVVMPDKDFIRVENPMALAVMKPEDAKVYYRKHVNTVKEAAFKLYQHKDIKTVCIDTGTQLWEDMLFAEFGRSQRIMPRDRGPCNQEMIDFLNALSGKNLIVTHRAKEIWSGGDAGKPTGRYEHAGFPHLGYYVNVLAEFVCDEKKKAEDEERYYMNISLCQANADIQGPAGKKFLADDMVTFMALAMSIYPDSDPESWS